MSTGPRHLALQGNAARHISRSGSCVRAVTDTRWTTDRVHEAVVEEVSMIRHMIGQTDWQPRRIASVRTSDGQLITVGLRDESGPGTVIELFEDGTAPFGQAKPDRVGESRDLYARLQDWYRAT